MTHLPLHSTCVALDESPTSMQQNSIEHAHYGFRRRRRSSLWMCAMTAATFLPAAGAFYAPTRGWNKIPSGTSTATSRSSSSALFYYTTSSSSSSSAFSQQQALESSWRNNMMATDHPPTTISNPFYNEQVHQEPLPVWLDDTSEELEVHLRGLEEAMRASYYSDQEILLLRSALHQASEGSTRLMSGGAVFLRILVETMEMGMDALVAGTFHYCACVQARANPQPTFSTDDNVESSNSSQRWRHKQLSSTAFGEHVVQIEKDAARLKRLEVVGSMVVPQSTKSYSSPQAATGENLAKLYMSEAKDWRALAIRSAACLYRLFGILRARQQEATNWRLTPEYISISREALHIYAPLASRLGMHRLKNELENAAFQVLYRRQYETVASLQHQRRRRGLYHAKSAAGKDITECMHFILGSVQEQLTEVLKNDFEFAMHVHDFTVTARIKEAYSTWKKMIRYKAEHIYQIPDAIALRIVLNAKRAPGENIQVTRARERALCYYAQRLCMQHWKPATPDARFKDYIENPKPNGYQSLHYTATTQYGGEDWTLEIQVRSGEMHKVAEFGLASHWDYKARAKVPVSSPDSVPGDQDAGAQAISEYLGRSHAITNTGAYLQSLQEWHWKQQQSRQGGDFHLQSSSTTTLQQEDPHQAMDKERAEARLAPYIEALEETQVDLTRAHVFVFCGGSLVALPAGSTVLDALSAVGGVGAQQLLHNGVAVVDWTTPLTNGDVLTVAVSPPSSTQWNSYEDESSAYYLS